MHKNIMPFCPIYGIRCSFGEACRHFLPSLSKSREISDVGASARGVSFALNPVALAAGTTAGVRSARALKKEKYQQSKRENQQLKSFVAEEVKKVVKPEATIVNTKKEDKSKAWSQLVARSADYQVRHKIFLQKKQKRDTFRQALSTAQAALKKDEKDVKSPVKLNWVDEPLDNDDEVDREGQLLAAELKEMRTAAREMWGTRIFKITLFESVLFATNGSGVCNTTVPIDPSTLTEFSSVAQLFDEYRDVAYEYSFALMSALSNSGIGLNPLCGIGYDPTDGTTVASLATLCQLQQHILVKKNVFSGANTIISSNNNLIKFDVKVPEGVLSAVANPNSTGTSNWQPTGISGGANIQPYGWLKAFSDNTGTSSSCYGGVGKHHCEFRMRS